MKKLKIDFVVNDGSSLGVVMPDIMGENGRIGVGGSEMALLTVCEALTKAGHDIRLYNTPTHVGVSSFPQYHIDTFLPHEGRDVVVAFRSPNQRVEKAEGKKIWWSCDQFTVGNFAKFSSMVDEIITISPFHAEYFKNTYGIEKTHTIDLPVRIEDYSDSVSKIKHRMIFCSVPARGLNVLAQAYPRIKQAIPDASLTVTSDYRLWGVPEPRNEQFIRRFLGMDGVRFLGAVPRREMVQEQLLAEVQAYPNAFDQEELFCYSVAECQVAGALPVTSSRGALGTTNMGVQVPGEASNPHWIPNFSEAVIETLLDKHLPEKQKEISEKAKCRFSLEKIIGEWERIMYA